MSEAISAKSFWKWKEYALTLTKIDLAKKPLITAGIDVGSTGTKAFILADGKPVAATLICTQISSEESAKRVFQWALETAGISQQDISYIVATGYGRVNVPFANRTVTEIACHALGSHYTFGPSVRTVIDIGGQDIKVIRVDERGRVISFLMNDKCASGTGRSFESFANLTAIPIEEIGPLSMKALGSEPPLTNNVCVIFARTQTLSMLRSGMSKEIVAGAYCKAMADRVVEIARKLGIEPDLAIAGGTAKNIGVLARIEKELGIKSLKPNIDPIFNGALGAGLFAFAYLRKQLRKGSEG